MSYSDNVQAIHVVSVENVNFGQEILSLLSCQCVTKFHSVVKV